jgi:hypothetical protein
VLTTEQRNLFRRAESDLDVLTVDRILSLLVTISPNDWAEALQDSIPELVEEMGDISAAIGADAYDLARDQADIRSPYGAYLADPLPRGRVDGTLRWVISADDPAVIRERAAVSTPRLVRESNRLTVVENTLRDPARPQFRRVPSAGACGFCIMLAARGTAYWTEESASTSSGRGRRKGARANAGGAYHDHCKCRVEQVYSGEPEPEEVKEFTQQWASATKGYKGMDAIRAFNRKVAAERVAEGGV